MSSKWIKALVLMFIIVVLLVAAGCIPPKDNTAVQPTGGQPSAAATDSAVPTAAETPTQAAEPAQAGWVNQDGKSYYYQDGVLQKDTVVGNDTDGFFYVGADGARDDGYCNALELNGTKWNIIEGKASRVGDQWDECLHSALYHVGKCTNSSMTRDEKLRAAFDYIKSDDNFLEGVLHDPPYNELDWPVVCANDLFVEGMGDCFSYGAAFAFMGKAIGCENCYACNSGGHGWAEIDGKAYDPEWDMHHQEYNHFGVSPEDDCDVAYFTTLTEGVDWMYVRL